MSYLDEYGVADARREKILKALVVSLVLCVIGGACLFFWFKNYFEERQVREFLSRLQSQDYAAAYELWGCSVEVPCRHYSYQNFLEDWGPNSSIGKVERFRLGRSTELDNGVIVEIEVNGRLEPELWVEKDNKTVGFSPYRFRRSLSVSSPEKVSSYYGR